MELRRGKSAAWVTEGDPLFYSTFVHLHEEMSRYPEIRVEIIPGVTSASAAAARVGLPVARLDEQVAVVPAAYGLEHLAALLDEFATVFLLKVHVVFDELLTVLASVRGSVRAVYLEQVGTPAEPRRHGPGIVARPGLALFLAGDAAQGDKTVNGQGRLFVVGLGPGGREAMTGQALEALRQAEVVVGYDGYFTWVRDLVAGKECLSLPLTQEAERARVAVERLRQGRVVCVISSGDPGVYGMAGLVLQCLGDEGQEDVAVIPGVSAVNAAAALLGAPLGHDFAVVSLSDLLTPWATIERRLRAAAEADFVLAILNPKSQRRDWQYRRAQEILAEFRLPQTPVGIVRNAYRPGQSIERTTVAEMTEAVVDMFTTVIVGNSQTRRFGKVIVTPRGYSLPSEEG